MFLFKNTKYKCISGAVRPSNSLAENQKGVKCSMMFHGEPEGRYISL